MNKIYKQRRVKPYQANTKPTAIYEGDIPF